MSKTRHLVDPEILPMPEMPDRHLTAETLEDIRNDPLFWGAIHAFEMVPDTTLAQRGTMGLKRGLDRLLGE